jgi:hypothetical protein
VWNAISGATNRALAYVALGSVVVIVGLQGVIFGIWGSEGDPPNAVVAVAFVLFRGFGSQLDRCSGHGGPSIRASRCRSN